MSRLAIAIAIAFTVAALGLAPVVGHAQEAPRRAWHEQEAPSRAWHEQERRAALHHEAVAVTMLYVSSLVLGTYALVAGPLGYIGSVTGPACVPGASCARGSGAFGLFLSAIVAGALATVLVFIATGLDVDRRSRQGALDRLVGRVRAAPGPGDIGLGLAIVLDG